MNKFFKLMLVGTTLFLSGFALASCVDKQDKQVVENKDKIAKASMMSEAELVKAAKEEIKDGKLKVKSQTSGTYKTMKKFKEKYGIDFDETFVKSTSKDTQLYQSLDLVANGSYYSDLVVIQEAKTLHQYMDQEIVLNYVPKDIKLAEEDKAPLAVTYYNKLFLYNKKDIADSNFFYNVWQLAGSKDDQGHISKLSFQNPLNEKINNGFLLTMTSPKSMEMLKKAYKEYYKKEYVDEKEYKNIGYKYIYEFLKNISTYHSSDTTVIKESVPKDKDKDRTVFFGPFAKYKDLVKALDTIDKGKGEEQAKEILAWNYPLEGFKGYLYKMYAVLPATTKYPYAAALFARFMLTPEGFNAAYQGLYGYYSANPEVKIADGDKTIDEWKKLCLVEDGKFLQGVPREVSEYIKQTVQG